MLFRCIHLISNDDMYESILVIESYNSHIHFGNGCGRVMISNFQCRGVLSIWIMVGQEPAVFAVGADGNCRLKYCAIEPLRW